MKSLNQVIFKGTVGRDARIANVNNRRVANFSVATEYNTKTKDGNYANETTWLNVSAWDGFGICNLDSLVKGAKVSGTGRLRSRKYLDSQNNEHEIWEVLADSLDIIAETAQKTPVNESSASGNKINNPIDDFEF